MKIKSDIDIDMPGSFNPSLFFENYVTKASMWNHNTLKSHPCGVYFQNIPKDPLLNISAITYEDAQELGFFKVDFLHVNIYNYFESKEEIKNLLKIEPNWLLLESPSAVAQLFQLSKHHDILRKVKPKSILELADVLALIRPGKIYVLDLYLRDKEKGRKELYKLDSSGAPSFKKSHAVAYALVVVLQLHLIDSGIEF